jgi:hypothetical protein
MDINRGKWYVGAQYIAPLLLVLLLMGCAAQPAAPALTSAPTLEPLPAQNVTDLPPTATTDPLLATMELLTMPPLSFYESPRFGYSFRYPVTSAITIGGEGETVWIDQQIQIRVMAINPEEIQGDGPVIESADSTFVNGIAARRLAGYVGAVGGNTPQRYQTLVIPANNRFYTITAYELRTDVVLPIDRTMGDIPLPVLSIFDTIIGTFQITS